MVFKRKKNSKQKEGRKLVLKLVPNRMGGRDEDAPLVLSPGNLIIFGQSELGNVQHPFSSKPGSAPLCVPSQ